jgi:hypothetical protein
VSGALIVSIVCRICDRRLTREELRDELCACCKASEAGIDEILRYLDALPEEDLSSLRLAD